MVGSESFAWLFFLVHTPLFKNIDTMHDFEWLLRLGSKDFAFELEQSAFAKVEQSYRRMLLHIGKQKVYGVHTQYGNDIEIQLELDNWQSNQQELLEFLSVGTGPAMEPSVVRRALRLQAYKVSQGYSGIHPETFARLVDLCNADNIPPVPAYGSLGASGDLIPMAHAVAPLFCRVPPAGPRDVLGLVNTNSMMAALSIELLDQLTDAIDKTVTITSMVTIGLGISDESFRAEGFLAVPHQKCRAEAAERIVRCRQKLIKERGQGGGDCNAPVQARYSVRCTPQIIGNAIQLMHFARQLVGAEAMSVADNPLVLENEMWHGGHFYTAGLASAVDLMADCVGRLGEALDRQTFLLVTETESNGLPRNLQSEGFGHLKGIHQLCNSLAQKLRGYSVPSRILSGPAESYNQDVVPASMMALLNLKESLLVLRELQRAAKFIADRGVSLRLNQKVSSELALSRWPSYEL